MKLRGLWKLPSGRDWLWVKLGLGLVGKMMLSKSLIQFYADGWGCVPSPRPNYGRDNVSNGDLHQKDLCQHTSAPRTVVFSAPDPVAGHYWSTPLPDTPGHSRQVWLSLLWHHCSVLLDPGAHKVLFVPSKSLFPQSCGSSVIKFHWPSKSFPIYIVTTIKLCSVVLIWKKKMFLTTTTK